LEVGRHEVGFSWQILKTGRKTVILNAPALPVLAGLDRHGSYVVPGDDPEKPRADLKHPWEAEAKRREARRIGDAVETRSHAIVALKFTTDFNYTSDSSQAPNKLPTGAKLWKTLS